MIVFGWVVVSLGTMGLVGSLVLEAIKKEPVFMLLAKVSMGVMAIGGTILGTLALMGG